MKFRPSLIVIMVFAGCIAMTSCTKKYTCHCNFVYTGVPGLPDSAYKEFSVTDSKSGATSTCKAQSGSFDNNGIHTDETCYLY
jgi:hypothetical protein